MFAFIFKMSPGFYGISQMKRLVCRPYTVHAHYPIHRCTTKLCIVYQQLHVYMTHTSDVFSLITLSPSVFMVWIITPCMFTIVYDSLSVPN